MKAAAYAKLGGLEVLEIMHLSTPQPGPGQVRIKVEACSLNHIDIWVRTGRPMDIPMPHIGGCDVVGVIDALGAGVSGWSVGQRVVVSPGQGCGHCEQCLAGWENRCNSFRVMGLHHQGGFAEYTVADARFLHPVSDAWSPAEWACFPLAALTAWNMVIAKGELGPGDDILIQAGSSGIGAFGIQLAKRAGARVWTTAGSKEKLEKARALGADYVINYKTENFVERVMADTGGRGVDVVFEHVGKETWPGSLACLRRGGRMVHCGVTTGSEVQIDIRPLYSREISIHGGYLGRQADLVTILKLAERKELVPVLDRVFPLEETAAAQQYMLDRKHFGKIVVAPA